MPPYTCVWEKPNSRWSPPRTRQREAYQHTAVDYSDFYEYRQPPVTYVPRPRTWQPTYSRRCTEIREEIREDRRRAEIREDRRRAEIREDRRRTEIREEIREDRRRAEIREEIREELHSIRAEFLLVVQDFKSLVQNLQEEHNNGASLTSPKTERQTADEDEAYKKHDPMKSNTVTPSPSVVHAPPIPQPPPVSVVTLERELLVQIPVQAAILGDDGNEHEQVWSAAIEELISNEDASNVPSQVVEGTNQYADKGNGLVAGKDLIKVMDVETDHWVQDDACKEEFKAVTKCEFGVETFNVFSPRSHSQECEMSYCAKCIQGGLVLTGVAVGSCGNFGINSRLLSARRVFDPGGGSGVHLLRGFHLEDKVDFNGGGVDTILSRKYLIFYYLI